MKIVISILIGLLGLMPTWIFILVKTLLSPDGFWQKFAVYGLGVYFLGALQIVFLVLVLTAIFEIYD